MENLEKVELNTSHRCDYCGVQAVARVIRTEDFISLLFCGHHTNKHEKALIEQGFSILRNSN